MQIKSTMESFQLSSSTEAEGLIVAVKSLIKCSLYDSSVTMTDFVSTNLPADKIDARVSKLILSILDNCSSEWVECSVLGRVGLPKLVESSWRVDVEGENSNDRQPKVVVGMGVQDHAKIAGSMEGVR